MEKQKIFLDQVPPRLPLDLVGPRQVDAANIIVLPILFEGEVKGVLELASFERFNPAHHALLDQLTESIGIVLHTIESNTRTEDLLTQSQSLAGELQSQQEELRQTNQQLEEKAALLAERNVEVENKNQEVEQARLALEEKARQLTLTSKYKSEFLANMSHELRTPLNSLLILSDQLSRNPDGNLTRQADRVLARRSTRRARTCSPSSTTSSTSRRSSRARSWWTSGSCRLADLLDYVDRTFRHVAEARKLEFQIDTSRRSRGSLATDAKRLQQVIKNLLSNAFKFTERGRVALRIETVADGWGPAASPSTTRSR